MPRLSIILCVKNGMPYLRDALGSMAAQTYRDYEIIVQDSVSTDSTLETLAEFPDLPLKIISAPDTGIGDAYNKALSRCTGEIIGSIDSDNLLAPNALERAADVFSNQPDLAALYFHVRMISEQGEHLHAFQPGNFDLEKFLAAELVPPFSTSFFNRSLCGDRLFFDPALKTCADFDLWLRLSDVRVECVDEILGFTRISDASMTCRPETYSQYCKDKTFALSRFLKSHPKGKPLSQKANQYQAGIYLWAALAVWHMEGLTDYCISFYEKAKSLSPDYWWTKDFEENYLNNP